jgi:hypothetical protein
MKNKSGKPTNQISTSQDLEDQTIPNDYANETITSKSLASLNKCKVKTGMVVFSNNLSR